MAVRHQAGSPGAGSQSGISLIPHPAEQCAEPPHKLKEHKFSLGYSFSLDVAHSLSPCLAADSAHSAPLSSLLLRSSSAGAGERPEEKQVTRAQAALFSRQIQEARYRPADGRQ